MTGQIRASWKKSALVLVAIVFASMTAVAQERYVVADRPSSRIQAFNVSNDALVSNSLSGTNPEGIAISPNGRLVAVANVNGSYVSIVDVTVNAEVAQIKNVTAFALAFDATGDRLVIPNRVADEVVIVDTSTFQVLQRVSVNGLLGDDPANNADTNLGPIIIVGTKAYVMNGGFNTVTGNNFLVAVVDIFSYTVSSVPGTDGSGALFLNNTLAATPDGQFVLATQTSDGTVQIISTASNTVVQTVSIPAGPTAIAISRILNDPNGVFAYATSFPTVANSSADLNVIDLRPASATYRQVIATIHLPGSVVPQLTEIQLTEDDARAYVALGSSASPNLLVVDTGLLLSNPANAVIKQLQVGSDLRALAVGMTATTPPVSAPVVSQALPVSTINNTMTSVRITGTNIDPDARVRIGGLDPVAGTVSSSSVVDVIVPAGTPSQLADIIVIDPKSAGPVSGQQQSGILRGTLTIASPPSFSPNFQVLIGSFGQSVLNILNSGNASAVTPSSPSLTLSPFGIALTPDGTHAFVSLFSSGSFSTFPAQVAIYNLLTNQVEKIVTLPALFGGAGQGDSVAIVPSPFTGKPIAYVVIGVRTGAGPTRKRLEQLVALDADTTSVSFGSVLFTQDASYPNIARNRAGLAATPDGKFVYSSALIPGSADGRLIIFDVLGGTTTTLSTTALGVDSFLNYVHLSPDGKSLLLVNTTTGGILVFDVGVNPTNPTLVTKITGTPPMGVPAVLYNSAVVHGNQLFGFDPANNILQAFNFDRTNSNFSQLGSFVIPGSTGGFGALGVTPDGKQIYVPIQTDNNVAVIDAGLLVAGNPSPLLTKIGTALAPLGVAIRAGTPTPAGNGVVTNPIPGVSITGNVTVGGVSNAATLTSAPLAVPAGFRAGVPPIFYQLSTTATLSGLQTVCFSYAGVRYFDETKLHLFEIQGGTWMDVTLSVDNVNKIVCGQVASLGLFGIFERFQPNPVPTITGPVSPLTVAPGSGSFTLTVNGTGFVAGCVLKWNGVSLPTTFVSSTRLTGIVAAGLITTNGTGNVTVFSPGPGGGTSGTFGVNVTTPTLAAAFTITSFGTGNGPSSIRLADLNGDGFPDAIITNFGDNSVTVFLADGAGGFLPGVNYPTSLMPVAVKVGHFHRGKHPDLVVVSQGSNCISVLLNNDDGTFGAKTDFFVGQTPTDVEVGDFDGDGNLDVVVTNSGSNTISLLTGFGDGSFAPHRDFPTSSLPQAVGVGDFNGDGILDVVVSNQGSSCISLLLGLAGGGFAPKVDFIIGLLPHGLIVGDFNGDGFLDVFTACSGSNAVYGLFGNGAGGFGAPVIFPTAPGPNSITAGDFNGDGILDIAVGGDGGFVTVLPGTGNGGFGGGASFPTGGDDVGIAAGDVGNTGRPDILVVDKTAKKCHHLHNFIDTTPPVITPPANIIVPATEAGGARGSAWPALAAFLAGGTAVDDGDPNPQRLTPQVNGVDATNSTLFPIGATAVTFRFQDASGNIGSAAATVTVNIGRPRIAGTIIGKGAGPSGTRFYDVQLANTGTGNARNLVATQILLRTLSGTGTVTYNASLSPALPLALGSLNVGATTTIRIYLNVPPTVTRFSITENGTVQDVIGTNYAYSAGQSTTP
jgi:DNA-binding beta-propeller fold protein YncE